MNRRFINAWHMLIMLFCMWHMLAIAVYALPWRATDPVSPKIRGALNPWLSPYTFSLSQWQQWDLFSPDPLRRVTWYKVQRRTHEGYWEDVAIISATGMPWWRHATHAKLNINLFEQDQDTYRPAIANLAVQRVCGEHNLAPGTQLRLSYEGYVVEYNREAEPGQHPWQKEPFLNPGLVTACPS